MKQIATTVAQVVVCVAVVYGLSVVTWNWIFCRTYCPLDYSLLITSKTGEVAPKEEKRCGPGEGGVRSKSSKTIRDSQTRASKG